MTKLFYNTKETCQALGIKDLQTLANIDEFLKPFRGKRNQKIYQVSKLEQRYINYLKTIQ